MSLFRYIIILNLLATAVVSYAQENQYTSESVYTIKGVVIDSKSNDSIPAVLVTLFFDEKHYIFTISDLDGTFILHVPRNKLLSDKSYIEFLMFTYDRVIINENLDKIRELTVKMDYNKMSPLTKEKHLELYNERYKLNE
jgi:hypothetical protein